MFLSLYTLFWIIVDFIRMIYVYNCDFFLFRNYKEVPNLLLLLQLTGSIKVGNNNYLFWNAFYSILNKNVKSSSKESTKTFLTTLI